MTGEERDLPPDGSLEGPPGEAAGQDGESTRDPAVEGPDAKRPEIDVESAFAQLVASYGMETPRGLGPWPAAEDVDPQEDLPRERHRGDGPQEPARQADPRRPGPEGMGHRIIPGEPVEDVDELSGQPDEEGYTPPEPPPLPKGDLVSRSAWAGVIGGPVFLLVAALAWTDLPPVLLLLALTAFVGGFVTLVARMPGQAPDDPDDGAVV